MRLRPSLLSLVMSCFVLVQAPEVLYIEPMKSWRMYYAAWEPPPRALRRPPPNRAAAEMERVYQSGEVKGADFVRASIKADCLARLLVCSLRLVKTG